MAALHLGSLGKTPTVQNSWHTPCTVGGILPTRARRIGILRHEHCCFSCETSGHDARANPTGRGRANAAGGSGGLNVPEQDPQDAFAPGCLSSLCSSRRRAEVGSTAIVHRLSPLWKYRKPTMISPHSPPNVTPSFFSFWGFWMGGRR